MSARVIAKKYVVVLRLPTQGGKKKDFRGVPQTQERCAAEQAEYVRTGQDATYEEANAADLAPLKKAKQRVKQRREKKREIAANRLPGL